MKQTPHHVDTSTFSSVVHLFPTVQSVAEHNMDKLRTIGRRIATIKAIHTGCNASKTSSEEAGGLEPVVYLAPTAHVMLIVNLWVEAGLVNGAMGTVMSICYQSGGPPDLPLAVMVHFDNYAGPTLPDNTVPIVPIRRSWMNSGSHCSRLQIPLHLAWAVTIHKSQGLTLEKAVIDVGRKEFSSGLTYVACSRVRRLKDLLFAAPFPYERFLNLSKSTRLVERIQEDEHLRQMQQPYNTNIACLQEHLEEDQHLQSLHQQTITNLSSPHNIMLTNHNDHMLPAEENDGSVMQPVLSSPTTPSPQPVNTLQSLSMHTPSPLPMPSVSMDTPSPPPTVSMDTPSPPPSIAISMDTPSPPPSISMDTPSPPLSISMDIPSPPLSISMDTPSPPSPVDAIITPSPPISHPAMTPSPPISHAIMTPSPPISHATMTPSPPISHATMTPSPPISHATMTPSPPISHATMTPSPPISHATMTPSPPISHATMTPSPPISHATMTPSPPISHATMTPSPPISHATITSSPPISYATMTPSPPISHAIITLPPFTSHDHHTI